MSPAGPLPITRLVLEGMSLFMAPGGGGCCWLSVRRLSEITGLDKGTISKHRTQAVTFGWLIAEANPRHRQSLTFWSAIPDDVSIFRPGAVRRASVARTASAIAGSESVVPVELSSSLMQPCSHLLSGGTVQSRSKLYGLRAETVRSARTNRMSPPDQSYRYINDLQKAPLDTLAVVTPATGDQPTSEDAARARLDAWMRSDGFIQICRNSPELALKLTPPNCRVPGYETLVREATEKAKK